MAIKSEGEKKGGEISPNTKIYKIECCKCGKESNKRKDFKKLCDGFYCKKCVVKKRKEHREFLRRDIIGMRKRRSPEEIERDNLIPEIQGAKRRGANSISHTRGLYLTTQEKQLLFRKYITKGYSTKKAKECVKELTVHLRSLVEKLKGEGKSNEEIDRKFKEEFARLISQ